MKLTRDLAAAFEQMLAEEPVNDKVSSSQARLPEPPVDPSLIPTTLQSAFGEIDAMQIGLTRLRALLALQARQFEDLENRRPPIAPASVAARRLAALKRG